MNSRKFVIFFFVFISRCPNFGSKCDCEACSLKQQAESTSKLAETFPSILTAEGKKSPPRKDSCCSHKEKEINTHHHHDDYVIEDLSKTLEDSKIDSKSTSTTAKDTTIQPSSTKPKGLQQPQNQQQGDPVGPQKKSTTAKELRDLMYQHYCVGK